MIGSLRLLRSLSLARNPIPPVALATIARTLSCRRCLDLLDLSSTGAGDAGAHALLPLLQSAGCPRELRLKDNAIGSAGAMQLLHAGATSRGLLTLDLSNNAIDDTVSGSTRARFSHLMTPQVAPAIMTFCASVKGAKLILGGNYIGSSAKAAAAASLTHGCVVVI